MMIGVLERLSTTALESPLAMISELSFTIQRVYFRKIELLLVLPTLTDFIQLFKYKGAKNSNLYMKMSFLANFEVTKIRVGNTGYFSGHINFWFVSASSSLVTFARKTFSFREKIGCFCVPTSWCHVCKLERGKLRPKNYVNSTYFKRNHKTCPPFDLLSWRFTNN